MSDSATMPAAALRRTDLPKLSLGTKTAATLLAIVAAVVLPQLFHVIAATLRNRCRSSAVWRSVPRSTPQCGRQRP